MVWNLRDRLDSLLDACPDRAALARRVAAVVPAVTMGLVTMGAALAQNGTNGTAPGSGPIGLCGSPIATLANSFGPLAVTVLGLGGLGVAVAAHQWAGLKKDPSKAREVTEWRNRAVMAALGGVVIGWLVEQGLVAMGAAPPGCVSILPF